MSLSVTPAQTAAWRRQIFEQLHERTKREMDNFRHYEQAIEQVRAVQQQFGPAFVLIFRIFAIFLPLCGISTLPPSILHQFTPPMQSVWVKKGTMQWWRDWKPHKWIDVHFALEQFSGPEGNKDGILFIYYNFHEEKKVCVRILYPWMPTRPWQFNTNQRCSVGASSFLLDSPRPLPPVPSCLRQ